MVTAGDESALIAALRTGDRDAFARLVDAYTPALLRVARAWNAELGIAEDVVQETWMSFVRAIGEYEGESALQAWLFVAMVSTAKSRGGGQHRERDALIAAPGATVDPARFHGENHPGAGSWIEPPAAFPTDPGGSFLSNELWAVAQHGLDQLPVLQGAVVTLRDMLGFDSGDVCELLDLTPDHQLELLHRGRAAIRQVLENHVQSGTGIGSGISPLTEGPRP